MSDVVDFPGQTKLDLDPDRVLEAAKGKLESCMVIGFTSDTGKLYIASSTMDIASITCMQRAGQVFMDDKLYDQFRE